MLKELTEKRAAKMTGDEAGKSHRGSDSGSPAQPHRFCYPLATAVAIALDLLLPEAHRQPAASAASAARSSSRLRRILRARNALWVSGHEA
jgi:hypothetical protein